MSSSHTQQPIDDLIGKSLGQYEIIEQIGRGGMATVYRAQQTSINRAIAVKVLPRHFLHDPGFLERFKREVEVISSLEHPHILPIYDYGEAEGIPYIAMRYLAGGNMAQLVRRRLPAFAELVRPLEQVAQALDYAHQQGIIHRDLKPANIMLDETGNAYLTDFGIARVMDSKLTGSAIIGTPAYMSPEQANGFPLDARSDIYSLGVVLYEMVTGREPYEASTPLGVLMKQIHEPMPSPRTMRPDIPAGIEAVLMRATAKNPTERYESAMAFAEAYETAHKLALQSHPDYDHEGTPTLPPSALPNRTPTPTPIASMSPHTPTITPATPITPLQATLTPPPTGGGQTIDLTASTQPEVTPTTASKTRTLWIGGAVVLVVAVLAAVFVLAQQPPEAPVQVVLPTAFPGARVLRDDHFSLSIPDNWVMREESTEARDYFVWQEPNGLANITLANLPADLSKFEQAIEFYDTAYYNDPKRSAYIHPIDEANAPDGSLRRSYRVEGADDLPNGQIDVFYLPRDPYLVVIEAYSADSMGNRYVPVFQFVIDSLRVNRSH